MSTDDRREGENDEAYLGRKTAERQWALLSQDEREVHAKSLSQDTEHDVKPKED